MILSLNVGGTLCKLAMALILSIILIFSGSASSFSVMPANAQPTTKHFQIEFENLRTSKTVDGSFIASSSLVLETDVEVDVAPGWMGPNSARVIQGGAFDKTIQATFRYSIEACNDKKTAEKNYETYIVGSYMQLQDEEERFGFQLQVLSNEINTLAVSCSGEPYEYAFSPNEGVLGSPEESLEELRHGKTTDYSAPPTLVALTTVRVTTDNSAPIAIVGPEQTVFPNDIVTLDGSASYDPDGDSLTYTWTQVEGPKVALKNAKSAKPNFVAPSVKPESFVSTSGSPDVLLDIWQALTQGWQEAAAANTSELVFQLVVNDGILSSLPAKVVIKIAPVKLAIKVSPVELDPTATKPSSMLTITATNADGTPAKNKKIKVQVCTEIGSATTDGHLHDKRKDRCDKGDRPQPVVDHSGKSNKEPQKAFTATTDKIGEIKMTYTPPKSKGGYYVSGKAIILASLVSDPSIKVENSITTKVDKLEPIAGSVATKCKKNGTYGGGGTYFFEVQGKHGCLFYGTPKTNQAIIEIANAFAEKQIACRDNNAKHQCDITDDKGRKKTITITSNDPVPIKITAMNLPWGGLSDISGKWEQPHKSHKSGKEVDIGMSNLDNDRIYLLRHVIEQNSNYKKFISNEGGDIAKTLKTKAPHFHVDFKK